MGGSRRPEISRFAACLFLAGAATALPAQQSRVGRVSIDGDRIHYEVAGTGPALILLHDGLTHGGVWEAQFDRFAQRHRVVRYDRRGHGRSDVPTRVYSPVEDLGALLDRLAIDRAVLVGASAGGRLAIDFSLAFPDRVAGLVLVGAVISGYAYSDHFRQRGRRNMAPLAEGDVERTLSNWVTDRYLLASDDPELRERLRRLMAPYSRKRFLEYDRGLVREPPAALGRLGRIAVPTLVIVGAGDVPDVHAHAGVLETGIPDATRVIVPDAGHLVPFERPDEFNRLVLEFLSPR